MPATDALLPAKGPAANRQSTILRLMGPSMEVTFDWLAGPEPPAVRLAPEVVIPTPQLAGRPEVGLAAVVDDPRQVLVVVVELGTNAEPLLRFYPPPIADREVQLILMQDHVAKARLCRSQQQRLDGIGTPPAEAEPCAEVQRAEPLRPSTTGTAS